MFRKSATNQPGYLHQMNMKKPLLLPIPDEGESVNDKSMSIDYSEMGRVSRGSSKIKSIQHFKDLNNEIKTGLKEITNDLRVRKNSSKIKLRGQIRTINSKEKNLKSISNKFSSTWLKIQRKTKFLSLLRKSLRNARCFGIDPTKVKCDDKAILIRKKSRKGFVIYPDSALLKIHLTIMMLIMVYFVIFLPIDLAFNLNETSRVLYGFDLMISIYFGLDILVSFFTAFEKHGRLVTTNKAIALNYMTKWFLFDLVSVLPLELFFENNNLKMKRLLKVPRMIRLINTLFQNSESKKSTRSMIVDKMKYLLSSAKVYHITTSLILAFLFIHVSACLWCFITNIEEVDWLKT